MSPPRLPNKMRLLMILCCSFLCISGQNRPGSKGTSGTLVVIGGYHPGSGGHSRVLQFELWEGQVVASVDAMPSPYTSWFTASAQDGNTIYVVGGRSEDSPDSASTRVMRLKWNNWHELPSLNHKDRHEPTAYVLGKKLHVTGGGNDIIEIMDLNNEIKGWTDSNLSLPLNVTSPVSAVIGDQVYISQGDQFLTLGPQDTQWTELPSPKVERRGHCIVSDTSSRLWILGGHNTLSVEMYGISTGKWEDKAPIPHYQHVLGGSGCIYHDGFIYLAGGQGTNFYNSSIYSYDVEKDVWQNYTSIMGAGRTELSAGLLVWG